MGDISTMRVSRSSRDLPSHVLVIASLLVCGARHFRTPSTSPFLVPTPLLGQTAYKRLLTKFDV